MMTSLPPTLPDGHPAASRSGSGSGLPGTHLLGLSLVVVALLFAGCTAPPPSEDGAEADAAGEDGSTDGSTPEDQDGTGDGTSKTGKAPEAREEAPWVGAWPGTWPDAENETLRKFYDETGHRHDKVNLLVSWNTSYGSLDPTLRHIATSGATPTVMWSPTGLTTGEIQDDSTRIHLANNNTTVTVGEYVDSYAEGICEFHEATGRTVLLEPMPEPNGNWHPWAVGYQDPETGDQPNSDRSYVQAWRHIHARFTSTCPDGATFVWSVNGANRGSGTSYMGAYPGAEHTDLVGIRGMNLGTHQPQGWASFGDTFGDAYCNLTRRTDHDVVLTAVGSVEEGGDKANWIRETYRDASSHHWDRIAGIVWYHDELEVDGQSLDVSLTSSPESLQAYETAVDEVRDGEIPQGEPPPC